MRTHSDGHNIELIYKGFEQSLSSFETKFTAIHYEFNHAVENHSIKWYNAIYQKVSGKFQKI